MLATTYLGFKLANPLVPGASPLCDDLDMARQLEDCGAPMLVMRSLFQEQIADVRQPDRLAACMMEDPVEFRMSPDQYLRHIGLLKAATRIPIVASFNCRTLGPWIDYAKLIEKAGADALELNVVKPVLDINLSSQEIEEQTLAMVTALRSQVQLPLAVKLMPDYTALPHFARELVRAGAQALVLFNRLYQPEMDVDHLVLRDKLRLSTPDELAPRIRAIAALAGRVRCDLSVTGGAHSASDVLRAILAGASVVQMVSALLQQGPHHLRRLIRELETWLDAHEFESLAQIHGSMSFLRTPPGKTLERNNLMAMLNRWDGKK